MNSELPSLSVVIPVYNEGKNISRTLRELEAHAPPHTAVLVVYDFPEDDTLPVLESFGPTPLEITPIQNTFGAGVVNAIKFGLDFAQTEAVLVVMGDLSDDLTILPEMLAQVGRGADIVCGSRYMRGGRHIGGPLFKKTLSRVAGVSLRYLIGFPTHDVTNSFKMYTRKVLNSLELESTGGFEVGMEIVVKAWVNGYQIRELPSTWRDRPAGESRFRLWAWLPYYLRWYFTAIAHRLKTIFS